MAQTLTQRFSLNKKNFNDRNDDVSSIYSSKGPSSLEDSYGTLQSYSDDSLLSNSYEIRRNHRYVKYSSKSNRNDEHTTSLKRRVRKQQSRRDQNPLSDSQLPLSSDLFLISYPQQSTISSPCRTKKSSYVVPLPPLITNSRAGRTRIRGIKLNMYGY